MATTRVQLPDGNIGEFPASMKPEEIEAVLAKQFPPESAAPPPPQPPDPIMSAHPLGLTEIDPHRMPHSMSDVGAEGIRALSNIGSGGIGALATMGRLTAVPDLLMGKPTIYEDAYHAMSHPLEAAKGMASSALHHPLETIEQGIGAAGAGALVDPEATFFDKIPNKQRAINTLNNVEEAAKNVPVSMTRTEPAISGFKDYVRTGGRPSAVINKLASRMSATGPRQPNMLRRMESELSGANPPVEPNPITFPEARKFYSNVSEASARPGFLRRAVEPSQMPKQRYSLGNVREAMANDLTNAAESVGQGDRYTQGIREFANAAKLNRALKIAGKSAGAVATEEALRRSGILGKMAAGAARMAGQ